MTAVFSWQTPSRLRTFLCFMVLEEEAATQGVLSVPWSKRWLSQNFLDPSLTSSQQLASGMCSSQQHWLPPSVAVNKQRQRRTPPTQNAGPSTHAQMFGRATILTFSFLQHAAEVLSVCDRHHSVAAWDATMGHSAQCSLPSANIASGLHMVSGVPSPNCTWHTASIMRHSIGMAASHVLYTIEIRVRLHTPLMLQSSDSLQCALCNWDQNP